MTAQPGRLAQNHDVEDVFAGGKAAALLAGEVVLWSWRAEPGRRCDFDALKVEFANEGGQHAVEVHPDDALLVEQALQAAAFGGRRYDLEYRALKGDGQVIWLHDRGEFLASGGGAARRGYGLRSDVTRYKLAEHDLRQSEERAVLALQASRVYAWERDIGSTSVRRTGAVEDVLGVEVGSIDAFIALVHSDDRLTVRSAITAAINNDVPYDLEFRFERPDGKQIWVSDVGRKLWVDGRERFVGLTADITERKQLEAAVHASESRFRDVAEASADWIWEADDGFSLTYVSDRFSEATGREASDVLGLPYTRFLRPSCGAPNWRGHNAQIAARASFRNVHAQFVDTHGRKRICRLSGQPAFDTQGHFIGYRGTASDATDEIEARERAERLALHDGLTGLPNRTLLYQRIQQALSARGAGKDVALLYIDLDFFKEVNDSFGHKAGDILLQQVTDLLISAKRKGDTVARIGGDEFVMVMTGLSDLEEVKTAARGLIGRAALPFMVDGNEIYIGLSVGAAVASTDGEEGDALLRAADTALYRAKSMGRGALCFFEPSLDAELQVRKGYEQDLRGAIKRDELELYFQTLVAVEDRAIVGVEALLRWHHPRDGEINPATFIPIAEQSGSILPIGEWVLRQACLSALEWRDIRLSVNISPVQFRQPGFVDMVGTILSQTGFPAERLELEITEGVLLLDTEGALRTFNRLKALGVRMSMDDFGTGYSSLSYLQRFAFDKIKIDQSFVRDINVDSGAASIVDMAIALAKRLGIEANAEGVETAAQFDILRAGGCDQVQGYLFCHPMPAAELALKLRAQPPAGFDAAALDLS